MKWDTMNLGVSSANKKDGSKFSRIRFIDNYANLRYSLAPEIARDGRHDVPLKAVKTRVIRLRHFETAESLVSRHSSRWNMLERSSSDNVGNYFRKIGELASLRDAAGLARKIADYLSQMNTSHGSN